MSNPIRITAFSLVVTLFLGLDHPPVARANWSPERRATPSCVDCAFGDHDGSITEGQVLGFFQRADPQSAWHSGIIRREGDGLVWINAAGVRWNLTPALRRLELNTDGTNPYYSVGDDSARRFSLVVRAGKVIGFSFRGEVYYREKPSKILGTYEKVTEEPGGHQRSVVQLDGDARFVWRDGDGRRWRLRMNFTTLQLLVEGALDTGARRAGPRHLRLEFGPDGGIAGFGFRGERWRKLDLGVASR